MKIFCQLFGHSDRPHYHRADDVVPCNGGCEKYITVAIITPCLWCGSTER